ncbi:hypothetical protein [Candidatus Liberibacter sp.]|uniref:hypothetical protein n=1 Tax=Candidatus Liberibacter sp. TaxID=34022 RepID=UPI0015F4A0B3|nr:hypothetical protein [Candidatus Liberibacter sp.]MBA5723818.1 hypothetical protein [Candidatus Liberibacter sp.]
MFRKLKGCDWVSPFVFLGKRYSPLDADIQIGKYLKTSSQNTTESHKQSKKLLFQWYWNWNMSFFVRGWKVIAESHRFYIVTFPLQDRELAWIYSYLNTHFKRMPHFPLETEWHYFGVSF